MGLRSAVALADGMDEEAVEAAASGAGHALSSEERFGLIVADRYLGDPAGLTAHEWREITTELSDDGVAVLALKLAQFSRNKVRVALGLDVAAIEVREY